MPEIQGNPVGGISKREDGNWDVGINGTLDAEHMRLLAEKLLSKIGTYAIIDMTPDLNTKTNLIATSVPVGRSRA